MKNLKEIKVIPVAFESLGVRSMCTFVKTPDTNILLDAGVSLGPTRFGFPPHPREYKAIRYRRNAMLEIADEVQIVTVSHYHFDHHTPSYTDWTCNWSSAEIAERIYKNKIVLAKSYQSEINPSQRRRGWMFTRTSSKHAQKLKFADKKFFSFGETMISFSGSVFHGQEGSELGWVLMTTVSYEEEKIVFAPDVQGPMSRMTLELIINEKPQMVIVGGPPLYLVDFRVNRQSIDSATKNLEEMVKHIPIIILDHHLLREQNWRENVSSLFDVASEKGHRLLTAAEFLGVDNLLLESQRRLLYENEPPSPEFIKWTKIPIQERKLVPPPI